MPKIITTQGHCSQADMEGYNAAMAGERCTANPYKAGTALAREWEQGWDEGFEEMGGNLHALGLGE